MCRNRLHATIESSTICAQAGIEVARRELLTAPRSRTQLAPHPRANALHRTLLQGVDGLPDNFEFGITTFKNDGNGSARHRHVFDQFRYAPKDPAGRASCTWRAAFSSTINLQGPSLPRSGACPLPSGLWSIDPDWEPGRRV
jgi:hypothetical protein